MSNLDEFFRKLDNGAFDKKPAQRRLPPVPQTPAVSPETCARQVASGFMFAAPRPLEKSTYTHTIVSHHSIADKNMAQQAADILFDKVKKDIAGRFSIPSNGVRLNARIVEDDGEFKVAFDAMHQEHLDGIRWNAINAELGGTGKSGKRP